MAAVRRGRRSRSPAAVSRGRVRGRVLSAGRDGWNSLLVVHLRALAGSNPNLRGCGGSPGSGSPSAARSSLISQSAAVFQSRSFLDRGGLPARLVIAQQMPDLVDQHGGVLFDRVRRHPRLVVVETPGVSTAMLPIRSVLTGTRVKSAGAK